MKIKLRQNWTQPRTGFTSTEMLVVMGTLVILCTGMIMANMYGASMAVRQQIWLSCSDDSAKTLGMLFSDIRSGASNYVGSMNAGVFTRASSNTWQQGNALQILQANTNGNVNGACLIYYYDPVTSNLCRTNWSGSNSGDFMMVTANEIMTNNVYGSNIFSAYGAPNGVWLPQSNQVGTYLIMVCLSYTKLQNPQVVIQPGGAVDFYQIVTYVASRNRP